MKKNIFYIFLLSAVLFACKKDENFAYNSADNIYLNYFDKDNVLDTLPVTYSFATKPGLAKDTIWLPVKLSGKRVSHDRKIVLEVVTGALTTAVKDKHYEPLKPEYILPADSGTVRIPLIIKNIDPELAVKSVGLTVRLVANADFGTGLPGKLLIKTVIYSNRLEEPSWWKYWQGQLGPYNRVTHQLFLISGGKDLVNPGAPNGFLEIPRTLYYLENLRVFVKDPFTWVQRNPEKGYVITKRTDGTQDYDFYNTSSPEIKFYVKYYPQVNGYFFINDKGTQIVM